MEDRDFIINQIKSDPYLSKVIVNNQISDDTIKSFFSLFNESLNSFNKCKTCPGLERCMQDCKGEVVTVAFDKEPYKVIRYCKHLVAYNSMINLQNKYVYTDVPRPLYSVNFTNIKPLDTFQEELFNIFDNIIKRNRKKGVFLIGDFGVGKTYFSCAFANTLVMNGFRVAFIKTNNFVTDMYSKLINDPEFYEKIVNDIKNADYVIFDDIGTENVSEFSRDRLLYNILDHRLENRLITMFTSNFDIDNLQKHFTLKGQGDNDPNAERICNRIKNLTNEYVLEGESKRDFYD